jgi:hypothetical protein
MTCARGAREGPEKGVKHEVPDLRIFGPETI